MTEHINKTDKKYQYSRPYPRHIVDAMDEVLKHTGPERWRKSAAVYLNLNPVNPENGLTAKQEYLSVVNDLKEKRSSLKNRFGEINPNKKGTVGGGDSLRENLEMPAGLWGFIKMFDPEAFDGKSNPDAKNNLNKLRLEFKELSVAEAF